MRALADRLISAAAAGFLMLGGMLALRHGVAAQDAALVRGSGVSLMGVSGLILLVHPPAAIHPWVRRLRGPQRGTAVTALAGDPRLLVLAAFTVLQLLDIATTVTGGRAGLAEGNPIAGEIASRMGFLTGYAAMKGAVVIALLLAMTRLPRRAGLFLGALGSVVMGLVVIHNILLISS